MSVRRKLWWWFNVIGVDIICVMDLIIFNGRCILLCCCKYTCDVGKFVVSLWMKFYCVKKSLSCKCGRCRCVCEWFVSVRWWYVFKSFVAVILLEK